MPQFNEESLDFSYSGIKAGAIRLAREHGISATGDPQRSPISAPRFRTRSSISSSTGSKRVWAASRRPEADGSRRSPAAWRRTAVCASGSRRGAEKHGVIVRLPEKRYCTDNAAMIAFAGLQKRDGAIDPRRVSARSRIA